MPPRKRVTPIVDSPDVTINLDTLEREGELPKEFSAEVNGKRYVFAAPDDIDWKVVITSEENAMLFISSAVSEKDRDEFIAQTIDWWKMKGLLSAYRAHFGVPSAGE